MAIRGINRNLFAPSLLGFFIYFKKICKDAKNPPVFG